MFPGGPLHNRGKRPHKYVTKSPGDESHHPPFNKVVHSSRREPLPSKSAVKPRCKATKLSSTKAANPVSVVVSRHATQAASLVQCLFLFNPFSPKDDDFSRPFGFKFGKPSAPEKKKKGVPAASQHSAISERLVYLTGIPKDASEEEVTNLVGSFGKINNVILIPCSGELSDPDEGQKVLI